MPGNDVSEPVEIDLWHEVVENVDCHARPHCMEKWLEIAYMLRRRLSNCSLCSDRDMAKSPRPDRVNVIYAALRKAILEQALEPGRRLPEDTIGEQFGVSRTLVRYALNQLASEGLVVQQRNRSATVAHPSWDDAQDTFEIRIALERFVVSRLVGALSQTQIDALLAHVREEEEAARNGNELLSLRLAGEFHIKLADMTESELLSRLAREFASRCSLILSLYSRPHSSECAVDEHRELVELLRKGDEARAIEAMSAHLRAVATRALVTPQRKKGRDIADILASYVEPN
jgi:DNA-binding GntR family transcriptional regulator